MKLFGLRLVWKNTGLGWRKESSDPPRWSWGGYFQRRFFGGLEGLHSLDARKVQKELWKVWWCWLSLEAHKKALDTENWKVRAKMKDNTAGGSWVDIKKILDEGGAISTTSKWGLLPFRRNIVALHITFRHCHSRGQLEIFSRIQHESEIQGKSTKKRQMIYLSTCSDDVS